MATKKAKQKSVSKHDSKKSGMTPLGAGVKPLGDRVLIRPAREEEKRVGALIIPATGEREKPDQGTVIAVGEGKYVEGKLVPVRIKVGDRVMFSKYSYDELRVDGEDLYVVREENILAIIK